MVDEVAHEGHSKYGDHLDRAVTAFYKIAGDKVTLAVVAKIVSMRDAADGIYFTDKEVRTNCGE